MWQLITQTPETCKGGQIRSVIVNINSALTGIGYRLLVLFFAIGIFSSAASFKELQRPEFALRHFIRFVLAKVAVGRGMEIMTVIFAIICADPPWRYRMYRGNGYIELFARRPARGWDVWGNEVVRDIVMKESDGID